MRRGALSLYLLTAGCAAQPEPVPTVEEMRAKLKTPAGLLDVFQRLIRTEQFKVAWKHCLAVDPATGRKVMEEDPFQLAMTRQEVRAVLPRLISSLEVHGVDEKAGIVRICSAEYGISREFKILLYFRRFWQFLFTTKDLDYFAEHALKWIRRQVDAADGRHFVHPPGWDYAKVSPHCGCPRPRS